MKRFTSPFRRSLAIAIWPVLSVFVSALPAQSPASSNPPADTCVLQIVTHAQAGITVDGRDYGGNREMTFSPLVAGMEYQSLVAVQFPDGRKDQRKVSLFGGKVVRTTIGPALVESFDFQDAYTPPPSRVADTLLKKMPYPVKPWSAEKKQAVRGWLQEVEQTAPYLMMRATAYRPVRMYLSADAGSRAAEVWIDSHALIVFERAFAQAVPSESLGPFILTHELTHLADCPRTISSREDWDRAVRPRIDHVWKGFKTQTGRDVADVWAMAKDSQAAKSDSELIGKLAKEQGLPTSYASYAVYEALAEYNALHAWKLYAPPAEIQAFLDTHLLSSTFATNRAVQNIYDALEAAEKDDLPRTIQALDDAVAADSTQAWAYLLRGKAREVSRQRDAALQDYAEAIRLNPRLYEAYSARGKILAAMDRYENAVDDLTHAIELNPLEETYFLDRANAYRNVKKYDAAIADYGSVIRRKPGAVGAIYARGDLHLEVKRYREAVADFSDLIKLFEGAPEIKAIYGQAYERRARAYVGLNQFDNAIADLSEALNIAPNYLPGYFMRGDLYRTVKKFDEAIADYTHLIEKSSSLAFPYYSRALAWQGKNQLDKALADLAAAIAHNPKYVEAYLERAQLRFRQNDATAAIADLDEVVKLAPADAKGYYVRAAVRSSINDFDRSIEDYNKVIELVPDHYQSVYLRGEAYAAKKDYDRAIADYTKVLASVPKHFDAIRRRGSAYFNKGGYAEALANYDRAVELQGDDAGVRNMRGRTLEKLGRVDEALADFDRAVELSPKFIWPYVNRAHIRALRGEYRRQIDDLNAAIGIDPKLHEAYVSLAWVYATAPDASVRDGRKAVEAATKACELSEWKDSNDLTNLACAYAEAGDFVEAVKQQTKAEQLYTPEMRNQWGFLLDLFKSGKPYHEKPVTTASP